MPWAGGVATEKATAPPPGSAAARVSVVGVFSSVVADRASATGIAGRMTVSVKVCGGLVSTPPLPVPPLSSRTRVIVADPLAPGFGVNVRSPDGETAGPALVSRGLVLPVTTNRTAWEASLAGPAEMPVAQRTNRWDPAVAATVRSEPRTKPGAWLTGSTLMATDAGGDVDTPLFAVNVKPSSPA